LSKLFGKQTVFVVSLFLTAASTMWLFFIPADRISLMIVQALSWGLAYGPTVPLLWSMIADAADYSEWKTGRRATGFVFAGIVFALKFGLGVGGFVQGMILAGYGYEGGAELTERAILGVRLCATLYPAGFVIAAAIILLFYPISKALNYQIGDELAIRRDDRTE
jgi:Na+/melibiose symporter-like transporter